MRIAESNVKLSSMNEQVKYSYREEELIIQDVPSQGLDIVELSKEEIAKEDKEFKESVNQFIADMKLRLFKYFIEQYTGKKIDTAEEYSSEIKLPSKGKNRATLDAIIGGNASANSVNQNSAPTRAIRYRYTDISYEKESIGFSAQGSIKTENGQEFNFELDMSMSREKYEQTSGELSINGQLIDPLILSLDNTGASFSSKKIAFDLDNDGTKEQIPTFSNISGYLAWDRNGNGKIDNGSELMGPTSGNGFDELRSIDSNGDGWLDENDPLFFSLSVWTPTENGTNFSSLKDNGIGALFTGSVDSAFNIAMDDVVHGDQQELAAVLKESGLFIKENGSAGLLQELDIVA